MYIILVGDSRWAASTTIASTPHSPPEDQVGGGIDLRSDDGGGGRGVAGFNDIYA